MSKMSFYKIKFQSQSLMVDQYITTHKRVEYLVAYSNNSSIVHLAHRLALPHLCGCHVHHPAQVLVYVVENRISKHVCQLEGDDGTAD